MAKKALGLLLCGVMAAGVVGAVTAASLYVSGEHRKQANAEALVEEARRLATDVQAWKFKPRSLGGGAGATWAAFKLQQVGQDAVEGRRATPNGQMTVTCTDRKVRIVATNAAHGNRIVVVVTGTREADVAVDVDMSYRPEVDRLD